MRPSKRLMTLFLASFFVPIAVNPLSAQDGSASGLNRVADLLDQLQSSGILAESPPPGEGTAVTSKQPENPFSTPGLLAAGLKAAGLEAAGLEAAGTIARDAGGSDRVDRRDSPRVEVGDQAIRINVGGKAFRVPRRTANENVDSDVARAALDFAQSIAGTDAGSIAGSGIGSLTQPGLDSAAMYLELGQATSDFSKGAYEQAESRLSRFTDAMSEQAMVAQLYALMLFQNGEFASAAEWAHNGLRSNKPFDWDTLQRLYGTPGDYAARYQALQKASRGEPDRIELRFLVGYHHLMLGHRRHAARELGVVADALPGDPIVQRLLTLAATRPVAPPKPSVQ